MADYGAKVNAWVGVVRRTRLGSITKLVALTLASYAKSDGTKIYPGVARIAVQCEIGYSTARKALEQLRAAKLVEVVKAGNRRTGTADEYRLILHPDLLDLADVMTPAGENKAIVAMNEQNTSAGRARQRSPASAKADDASALQRALKTAISATATAFISAPPVAPNLHSNHPVVSDGTSNVAELGAPPPQDCASEPSNEIESSGRSAFIAAARRAARGAPEPQPSDLSPEPEGTDR